MIWSASPESAPQCSSVTLTPSLTKTGDPSEGKVISFTDNILVSLLGDLIVEWFNVV